MSQHVYDHEFETMTEKPYPVGPAGYVPASTSPLAVTSLVFGVLAYLALPLVGAIVAAVTGHYALAQIGESGGRVEGRPLAKAGLALGYLQLALVAVACLVGAMILTWGLVEGRRYAAIPAMPAPAAVPSPAAAWRPSVAGVKMVNEMDRADFRLIEQAKVDAKPAEIVAFYNAGGPDDDPEFALVTTKGVVYLKDGAKTAIDFADVADLKDDPTYEKDYRSRKDADGRVVEDRPDPDSYHAEVRHKNGSRIHIRITPEPDGATFFEALKSAREAAAVGATAEASAAAK